MCRCEGCTAPCCRHVIVNIGNLTADQRRWAEMHGEVDRAGNWRLEARCQHLRADNKCGIYKARPQVCRDYEAGGAMCLAARAKEKGSSDVL